MAVGRGYECLSDSADFKGSGVFGGGRRNHLEATTKSKADTLLRYMGCEGRTMASAGKGCRDCSGLQGSQAQLGQKLSRTQGRC